MSHSNNHMVLKWNDDKIKTCKEGGKVIETYISEVTVQEKLEIHIIIMFWF